jgi:hypothetical protein
VIGVDGLVRLFTTPGYGEKPLERAPTLDTKLTSSLLPASAHVPPSFCQVHEAPLSIVSEEFIRLGLVTPLLQIPCITTEPESLHEGSDENFSTIGSPVLDERRTFGLLPEAVSPHSPPEFGTVMVVPVVHSLIVGADTVTFELAGVGISPVTFSIRQEPSEVSILGPRSIEPLPAISNFAPAGYRVAIEVAGMAKATSAAPSESRASFFFIFNCLPFGHRAVAVDVPWMPRPVGRGPYRPCTEATSSSAHPAAASRRRDSPTVVA